ncbi:MAG: hypothetical protein ACRDSP_21365 [Pseudonocardiaceae bacterium]
MVVPVAGRPGPPPHSRIPANLREVVAAYAVLRWDWLKIARILGCPTVRMVWVA